MPYDTNTYNDDRELTSYLWRNYRNLVNGKRWSLLQNRNMPIVIQFSFKGCGPCEEMYPDLRDLAAQHGDRISILSIMADEKLSDTMGALEAGKLTWNVAWDGFRGPVATRWAVQAFPTVYVVAPDGAIAASGLRGKQLREKIAELIK